MLILFFLACAARTPPVLYPEPFPRAVAVPVEVFDASADECPSAMAFVPSRPPPNVSNGVVQCRAQLMPDSMVFGLLADADTAAYWEDVAQACYDGRAADRAHGQAVANLLTLEADTAQREARLMRVAAPAAFVGGVVLGLGAGVAAGAISRP